EEADKLYRDVDINQGKGLPLSHDIKDAHVTLTPVNPDGQQESSSVSSQFVTSMLNPTSDVGMESIFATASSPVAPLQTSTPIMTPCTIATITTISHAPQQESSSVSSQFVTSMLNPASDVGMESIFATASSPVAPLQTSTPIMTPCTIATITTISHAPIPLMTIPSDVLQNLPTFDLVFHFNKRLKSLEAEVLTRSSHSSRTSYAITADLLEMELKKILIKKMEGNKSIQRSDEQRNLYKALVEAYEADKIILDTYRERVILKRRRDDDDDQEEPVQTTSQIEEPSHPVFETGAKDQHIVQTSQNPKWFSQLKKPPTLDRDWNKTLPAVQGSAQTWISELAKQADSHSSFNELLDTLIDFSNFIMNRLGVDT
nr:hypothetical protein [Tanacetum cinerariifolium]